MKELPWSYDETITAEECLIRFESKFSPIILSMYESDGDIMLSEYRELLALGWKLKSIVLKIKDTYNE